MRRRLTSRYLVVAIAALATAAVAALLYMGLDSGRAGTKERFDARARLAARFTTAYVQQLAAREGRIARAKLAGPVSQRQFAQVALAQDSNAAVLLDAGGRLLAVHPHRKRLVGRPIAGQYRHLEQAALGRPAVSDVVPSAAEAEPIIAVAVPFEAVGERRVFSAGFRVSQTPLDAFFERTIPVPGSAAYLVDGEGTVVASSRTQVVGRGLLDQQPDLARAATRGSGELELEGDVAHFVAEPVEGTRWYVLLVVPERSLYAPLAGTAKLQLLAFAAFTILLGVMLALALRLARTERKLEFQVQKLEATNRTLDTFSHTLVHDLRNPLTAIGGFAQTLDRILGDADGQVREMTRHIEKSAGRMHALIEDVLALATATRSVNRSVCDPGRMLVEIGADIPNLELHLGWLPEHVSADRGSISRSFENLLANAARYAREDDGRAHVHVSAEETPWHWTFRFEDGGSGVGEDERLRIFEAFQRGDEVQAAGTGLGLSIVAACAAAHGGHARVEESPRGGACFVVEIGKPQADDLLAEVGAEHPSEV